jgi:SAM-dependent methyltransferase
MHSRLDSVRKRLYTLRLNSKRCASEWNEPYWVADEDTRSVHCRNCPKFSSARSECTFPFGSPLRKCVSAAQEAHLHSLTGKSLLEIGFGKHSIPRRMVMSAGGQWTGIDPFCRSTEKAALGKAGLGHVADIPFADGTFDIVVGIQSFEHWAEPLPGNHSSNHEKGLDEVFRVLKPGGSIYFDAPIHLHGHEMFVAGDVGRIRGLFDPARWQDLIIEKWRQNYEPLARYPTPEADRAGWATSVTTYANELLEEIVTSRSVWLMTISATRRSVV